MDEVELKPICPEVPERLAGYPLFMYHCPYCGQMLLCGVPDPNHAKLAEGERDRVFEYWTKGEGHERLLKLKEKENKE